MPSRKINQIILHCSASSFGNALLINQWHMQRGWNRIGYHYVITNKNPHKTLVNCEIVDGMVETGRDPDRIGAHVMGHNKDSIGICMIGNSGQFTPKQLTTTRILICGLLARHHLAPEAVFGHSEYNSEKRCPGINMSLFRLFIQDYTKLEVLIARKDNG